MDVGKKKYFQLSTIFQFQQHTIGSKKATKENYIMYNRAKNLFNFKYVQYSVEKELIRSCMKSSAVVL